MTHKPHKCPVCEGTGQVWNEETLGMTLPTKKTCPACHGACVLWGEEASDARD